MNISVTISILSVFYIFKYQILFLHDHLFRHCHGNVLFNFTAT